MESSVPIGKATSLPLGTQSFNSVSQLQPTLLMRLHSSHSTLSVSLSSHNHYVTVQQRYFRMVNPFPVRYSSIWSSVPTSKMTENEKTSFFFSMVIVSNDLLPSEKRFVTLVKHQIHFFNLYQSTSKYKPYSISTPPNLSIPT